MAEQISDDPKQHNVAAYSSSEATEQYIQNAQEQGLRSLEQTVVREFFEPTGRVLDIGCGAGRTTHHLDERGFDVVGCDVSEPLVEAASDLYPDLDFQVGDVSTLPFADEQFAYALFSANGLDYIHPERARLEALSEVYRILEPGGIFAFSTHNSWYSLPAAVLSRPYLKQLYLEGGNQSRLFSPYKVFPQEFDTMTYISNPRRQRRQLRRCEFDVVEQVGKRSSPLKYFERVPYFVARKPDD